MQKAELRSTPTTRVWACFLLLHSAAKQHPGEKIHVERAGAKSVRQQRCVRGERDANVQRMRLRLRWKELDTVAETLELVHERFAF
jgi:hypothetical protein